MSRAPSYLSQRGLVVDLFAGGGGASTGLEAALGRAVSIAVNHSPTALAVHEANHPATKHLVTDVFDVDPLEATKGRRVDVLWASPDCTHFSVAKGGKPRSQGIRSLAEVVIQWATVLGPTRRPRLIFVENVREFLTWGPLDKHGHPDKARAGELFHRWKVRLELLGYVVEWRVLDASEFGAPTRELRLACRITVPYRANGDTPAGRCIEVSRDGSHFAAHTLCQHIITLPWGSADAVAFPPTCPACLCALEREVTS